jgi:hypothetical protein
MQRLNGRMHQHAEKHRSADDERQHDADFPTG